jgi:hypothetical protein
LALLAIGDSIDAVPSRPAQVTAGVATSEPARQDWRRDLVVVDAAAKVYHEPDCPVVEKLARPTVSVRAKAQTDKLTAHDCAKAKREAAASAKAASAAPLVWVDLKTKRYHLAGCSLVGLPRAQMPLSQARGKYRACNACKPPA